MLDRRAQQNHYATMTCTEHRGKKQEGKLLLASPESGTSTHPHNCSTHAAAAHPLSRRGTLPVHPVLVTALAEADPQKGGASVLLAILAHN